MTGMMSKQVKKWTVKQQQQQQHRPEKVMRMGVWWK